MDNYLLIDLVRNYPELYATNHPDYKSKVSKVSKDDLWERIGSAVGHYGGNDVKEQWRKLRECHREAIRRQMKRISEDPESRSQKPWAYQQEMEFLLPYMKKCYSNLPERMTDSNTACDVHVGSDNDDTTEDGPPDTDHEITTPSSNRRTTECITNGRPPAKKLKSGSDINQVIESLELNAESHGGIRKPIFEKSQSSHEQKDALALFFHSMYATTKALPAKYQRQVRDRVYEAVALAEEQYDYENSSSS